VPKLNLSKYEAITSLILWGFTQASWLLPAYFLEFKGYNTFFFIWVESLAFFAANVGLLSKFVRMYKEGKAKMKINLKKD
jgi:phosphatidylinositol glycan class M